MQQENYEVLKKFYHAFKIKNANELVSVYADDVQFSDPAFGDLQGEEAKAMWKMLLERDRNHVKLNFCDIEADETGGTVTWEAEYRYNNKPVFNRIESRMEIEDGKIVKHKDNFSLQRWASMAMGAKGIALGLTPFLKPQIRKMARKSLNSYLAQK